MRIKTDNEVNAEILERRTALLHQNTNPQVGDWVIFNDCERRISWTWRLGDNGEILPVSEWWIQTSGVGGSYYLGDGYVSYSGGLYTAIKGNLFQPTDEMRHAYIWFFSRDYWKAHNGVTFQIPFRVWKVNANAKEISC